MEYSELGTSKIKISKICLGTMTFGEQNNINEAHDQLDFAIDKGVICPTERDVIVELVSTSNPKLSDEVLALSSVIESSTSLLSALSRVIPPLVNVPPPVKVIVFAPTPIAVPE